MKYEFRGLSKIFSFTFRQQINRKGYKVSTILVCLLCLLLPIGILSGMAFFDRDSNEPSGAGAETEYAQEAAPQETAQLTKALSELSRIMVVNQTEEEGFSAAAMDNLFTALSASAAGGKEIAVFDCGEDFEKARELSDGADDTLIFLADKKASEYGLHLLIPENSDFDEEAAAALEPVFSAYGDEITGAGQDEEAEAVTAADSLKEILGFVLPYLNIMVLYFFLLFYGQGVTQVVIAEKSSRLMEFFLVSVSPTAMVLGKMTAVCLSGILQLSSWIIGLFGGFAIGGISARMINPDADIAVLQVFDALGEMTRGMFSPVSILLALLIMMAGMLLYCALAGIGGAVAEKQEDLASTNIVFTLALVASFFACLLSGGLESGAEAASWLDWVPFTSIMIMPAKVMLGSVSLIKGLASLLIVLVTAVVMAALAGRIYKMMALYRGKLPSLSQLLAMLRQPQ